ncbi:GNAT family N-acetyltransferase [Micromonospora sp. NPDC005367]|uniref:GNAT family N-acetyltransferase n=1 Tax=Micromonospora sp. NPDC005367 TaxID=3155590 RepID=UPI0033A882B6
MAEPGDRAEVDTLHEREWGGPYVIAHDTRYDLRTLPTLVAVDGAGAVVGALAYRCDAEGLEVVSLVAAVPGAGAGTTLLEVAASTAWAAGLPRLWLIAGNDNLRALCFYQQRGLCLVGVDPGGGEPGAPPEAGDPVRRGGRHPAARRADPGAAYRCRQLTAGAG